MPSDAYAYRPNGVIASLDNGIFNVFMRVSVSALRVGGYKGGEEGLRSGYDPRSLHRLSCLSGHNKTGMAVGLPSTQPVTCNGVCLAGCLSHWLPLNSQGLSAGRSGADSWMRRSGMPRYSVRARRGVGWAGGVRNLAVFARRTLRLHVQKPTVWLCL